MTISSFSKISDSSILNFMGDYLRPFESELIKVIEERRQRLGFDNLHNFCGWALKRDPDTAYRHYYRLKRTASGEAGPKEKACLTIEDALSLARALQLDLSDLIKQVESNLGYDQKPFPIPSRSNLTKSKKTA